MSLEKQINELEGVEMPDNKEALEALDDLQSCFDMEWTSSADGMFETIRQALQKPQVDVEKIATKIMDEWCNKENYHLDLQFGDGVVTTLRYLNEQGYLRSGWQPIETAPRDEVVFLKLEDETLIKASLRGGFMDSDGEDCFCWVAEQEYFPECWSCGECYEYNADGNRSIHPTAWQPLPTNTILEPLEKIGGEMSFLI